MKLKIILNVLYAFLGVALFYCAFFILLSLIVGLQKSLLFLFRDFLQFLKAIYPPDMAKFIINWDLLLGVWLILSMPVIISGTKYKLIYFIYLAYSILLPIIQFLYALGSWTMPGDHLEESPYPFIIGFVIVYCVIALLVWINLPEKFKR